MSILNHKQIAKASAEAVEEIRARKAGEKSLGLKTRWDKFNKVTGGGFQWGMNYLIAGLSGSGKSTYGNIVETDILDLNPEQEFMILNFNFETDSKMNLMKKFSADSGLRVDQILSSEKPLNDVDFNLIKEKAKRFDDYNIYYFDVSGTVQDIHDTVIHYVNTYKMPAFCILDHTGLVTQANRQSELEMVTELSKMTINLKKALPVSFLMLGQLNSNIESVDRMKSSALHKPMRSDLFGGKAVWNAMDSIFMPHRPELLSIDKYTQNEYPAKGNIFFHVVKQRFGKLGMLIMDSTRLGENIILEKEKP